MERIVGNKRKVGDDDVHLIVGGIHFSLPARKIMDHPDSELFRLWREVTSKEDHPKPIILERSGKRFQYIIDFIVTNAYPSAKNLTMKRMQSICVEAEYFKLPELQRNCENHIIRKIKKKDPYWPNARCIYWAKDPNHLVNVLANICAPFCIKSEWNSYCPDEFSNLYKSSTFKKLNIEELVADAVPSPFGKGAETLIDTNIRSSLEISADRFHEHAQIRINAFVESIQYKLRDFSPRHKLEVRPYKLVIYPEGGHFSEHCDSLRGPNHIGTVVLILPSEFTGGEFVVRHQEKEVSISKPHEWIALYGDCLHRVNPVLSGTRVCLLLDLYRVGAWTEEAYMRNSHPLFRHAGLERSVTAPTRARLVSALDQELEKYDNVVICLTHLYPVCQADPACLKGVDADLCAAIQDAAKYEVRIVPIAVTRIEDERCPDSNDVHGYVVDLQYSKSRDNSERQLGLRKTELVIPINVETKVVLHHKPYREHVGNESVAEETMYLVTGLFVSKTVSAAEDAGSSVTQMNTKDVDGSNANTDESSGDGIDSDSNNSDNNWRNENESCDESEGSGNEFGF